MTIHWKAVEQYFTVVVLVIQLYPVFNCGKYIDFGFGAVRSEKVNPLRPNNNLSQTSCNIQGLLVSEVLRIENMITQMKLY